jgi:O-6-methylguanine DNA methyltransferase
VRLFWSDLGLVRLDLDANAPLEEMAQVPELPLPQVYANFLKKYFAAEVVDVREVPVDLRGTDFQVRVWNALREIPWGSVRSYANVAADVGSPRGMRAVGMANAKNAIPIVVPCHRVVEQGNRLGGYSGGLDAKRYLLELEGVRVEGDQVLPGQLDLL